MPTVWLVPTNTELRGVEAGDYVLTPADGDGDYLLGRVGDDPGDGPHWCGRVDGSWLPQSVTASGVGDAVTQPDDQDALLAVVARVRQEQDEGAVGEPDHKSADAARSGDATPVPDAHRAGGAGPA